MGQRVALAKAANKLGVSRHKLQDLIRSGMLQTFEGRIDLDELRECFPTMSLDESPMLERTQRIKETAFGRRLQDRIAPEKGDLQTQLKRKTLDHDVVKAEAKRLREILEEMARLLQTGQQSADACEADVHRRLARWLAERLHN